MYDKKLYALTALFDTPDQIMDAAKKVADGGYKNWDVNTPYPVHGMDPAMKLGPSKLGYFTIIIGLTFMSLMLYFIFWTNNIDYPQVIGGKPFFAFPTYVPIMFEITILTGAVLTVAIMIAFFFKFPNNAHPLHDSGYMKATSRDKYGIYIEEKDGKFNADEIRSMFEALGASSINEVYYDEEEVTWKPQIWEPKFVIGLVAIAGFTSFSVYMHMNKVLFLPPFDWMMEQARVDYGEASDGTIRIGGDWTMQEGFFATAADWQKNRTPVQGTVARGFVPYAYKDQFEAGKYLSNPLPLTEENLVLGKRKYLTYCSPCHGNQGKGDSRIADFGIVGPSFHSDLYRGYEDGTIYHVITKGKGLMKGYEAQITRNERWAIIHYVRTLQEAYKNEGTEESAEMAEGGETMTSNENINAGGNE